jgi:hypothetical protein
VVRNSGLVTAKEQDDKRRVEELLVYLMFLSDEYPPRYSILEVMEEICTWVKTIYI